MKTTISTTTTKQYRCELNTQDIAKIILAHISKNEPDAKPFVNANSKFEVEFELTGSGDGAIITAKIKEESVS